MPLLTHTKFYGIDDMLHQVELSGVFSITKDGLHFEVVKAEENISFKIFDLNSTKLLKEGEIKADLQAVN